MRSFDDLAENEILALAIGAEEEDGRIYADFAHALGEDFPGSAEVFAGMATEEDGHRQRLIDLYVSKYGNHIPLVRRHDVRGFIQRRRVWYTRPLGLDVVRRRAQEMEQDAARFYRAAAARSTDAEIRRLLGDLATEEDKHSDKAETLHRAHLDTARRATEDETARRNFVLQIVQPGLVGLMDGSVSTLAPVFAAAFATHQSIQAFQVGLAASVGAGISMGFAEALADDGKLSGRGTPLIRGVVCGLMTTAGGIGHTLPFLIRDLRAALVLAFVVVLVELAAITWIRWRYMDTAPLPAAVQILFGGGLVFAAGIIIGTS